MPCIPKHLISKFKEAAMNGEVDIKKLYDMKSSEERRLYFTKFTDPELGKFINTEFEKAMVSKKKGALSDFVKNVITPEAKNKPVAKSMLDKIQKLSNEELLTPNADRGLLEDLVADRLGISVTPEEIEGIKTRAEKIDTAQKSLGNDVGNITERFDENMEFFKSKKVMDDYLKSLSPASNLRVATGTIGRGMMLASLKSPILNVGSNIEIGLAEAIARRVANGSIKSTDAKLAIDYVKKVNKIYQKTGYDLSRAMDINDLGVSGERVLGETVHTGGKGVVKKVGRVIEDVVFKQLMGAPDVAFASAHFADSVNIQALKIANGNQAKAKTYMVDAMRLKPQTKEGEVLRTQAIHDAQTATWTNETWASKTSEGIRKVINNVTGDTRLGDYLLPFVKTPANVIATGMDYAGMGIPKAMVEVVKGIRQGDLESRERVTNIVRDIVRSGIGMTGAAIIAYNLDEDNFVGAYDPARKQIEDLRGSNFNAVKIGNKWISTDWFGPLAVPITSMMYAKKYGKKGLAEGVFQYGKGVVSHIKQLPGVKDLVGATTATKKDEGVKEAVGEAVNYAVGELSSRLTPSIVSDIAKATDVYERKSTKGVEAIKAKIPGLRQTLPVKTNVFGEKMKAEPPASTILMGSRLNTSTETPLIKEIYDVGNAVDKTTKFTDWDKSSSKQLTQFKEKVGQETYDKAKIEYGIQLKKNLERITKSSNYKNMNNEDKYNEINKQDAEAMEKILKKHHFKYKKEKPSSIKGEVR
jgi:hypothetical protein